MADRPPSNSPPRPPRLPPDLEQFRPTRERPESPLKQLRPPAGVQPRPRPVPGQRPTGSPALPASRRDREPDDEGRHWLLSLLLWLGLGLGAIGGLGALALTIWSPAGLLRDQLAARIKAKTGRDLVIAGRTSLSFFPTLNISMSDVSLSAPPGMGGGPTITMQSLEAAVPLIPLLQRELSVQGLLLRKPAINLRVDGQGRRSWDFAALDDGLPLKRVQYAQALTRPQQGPMPKELKDFVKSSNPDSLEASISGGPLAALGALSLENVRIEGGSITYRDDRSGQAEEVSAVDARIALPNISSALDATGTLTWRGEPVAFETRLTSPKALSEDRAARLSLKLAGRPGDLDYEGTITLGRSPEAEGTIAAKSQALQTLFAMMGARPLLSGGAGSIKGRLNATEQSITVQDAIIALDDLRAAGTVTVESRAVRPFVRATLQIAELDFNRLMAAQPATARAAPLEAGRPGFPPPASPAPKAAQSIEDLLKETPPATGPKVRGFLQRTGWSDHELDLSAFKVLDADLKLSVGRLVYHEIKTGQTQVRIELKDRHLTATFDDIQLYEGRGSGLLKVDGTGVVPGVGANFSLSGTSALPLLKDAADFDWVSGRARVNLALGGRGATERLIVASLSGRADLQFANGAVVGYNVTKIVQGIGQGRFTGLERNFAEKTDFSEMSASFTIQNGIATNRDLKLTSPVVRITGSGTANLADRTMDYVLRPKIGAAPQPGAVPDPNASLEVPVKVAGSWDRPIVTADIDAVLKNPSQTIDTLKKFGKQWSKDNPEAVDKAKNFLNKFLKPN